jgi:hypothetical protein
LALNVLIYKKASMMLRNERKDYMHGTSLDEDLKAGWEESLQTLFQSLLKDWENPQQAKINEDLDIFMAKWVDGVQAIFALEAITPAKEESPDLLSSQDMNLPATEKSFGRRGKSKSTTLIPVESATVMRMIEKMSRGSQRSKTEGTVPRLSLSLEVKADKGEEAPLIPVRLKNLCQGMIELEFNDLGGINNPQTLRGKKATLHLTDAESQKAVNIEGTLNLTQAEHDEKINLTLRMKNEQANKAASKILENSLRTASTDTRMLRQLWDKTKTIQEATPNDQKANFMLLLLACGTLASSFLDPALFRSMECLLSAMGIEKLLEFVRERQPVDHENGKGAQ